MSIAVHNMAILILWDSANIDCKLSSTALRKQLAMAIVTCNLRMSSFQCLISHI